MQHVHGEDGPYSSTVPPPCSRGTTDPIVRSPSSWTRAHASTFPFLFLSTRIAMHVQCHSSPRVHVGWPPPPTSTNPFAILVDQSACRLDLPAIFPRNRRKGSCPGSNPGPPIDRPLSDPWIVGGSKSAAAIGVTSGSSSHVDQTHVRRRRRRRRRRASATWRAQRWSHAPPSTGATHASDGWTDGSKRACERRGRLTGGETHV